MNLPVVVKSTGMLILFLFKAARKAEFLENSFEVVTFPIWLDICWTKMLGEMAPAATHRLGKHFKNHNL